MPTTASSGSREAARGLEGLSLNVPTQKDYLAHLAFSIQQKNQGGADEEARGLVSRREAIEALSTRHLARARRERPAMTELEAGDEMARFLDYVCDETGLVLDRGNDQLSFIHLSFQEYLSAWVFLCDDEMPHGPSFFVEHLGDPAWEEVLLLRLYIVLREGGGVKRFDEILAAVLRSLERKSAPEGWLTLARTIRDDLEFTDRDRKEILGRALGFWLMAPVFEGMWYGALEEVKLFADRAREMLRGVIAEARGHARRSLEVIALLHLEAKFFAFPEDAAETLRRRADLGELLADLVPFAEEPAIRELLAEKATVADWIRALRALDGPEVYRMTVRWMTAAPAPAATEAATALLWDKILTDMRSRAAFAAPRRGHADAVLFEEPGALTATAPFCSATLPYAALRALPASLPGTASIPAASLLCASLAKARLEDAAAADAWSELTAWTASFIASQLNRFPADVPLDRDAMTGLAALFVRAFGLAFGLAFVRAFGRAFGRAFDRAFGVDLDEPGWEAAWDRAMEDDNNLLRLLGNETVWWALLSAGSDTIESRRKVEEILTELAGVYCGKERIEPDRGGAATRISLFLHGFRHTRVAYPGKEMPDDALEAWLLHNPVEAYATAFAWQEHCKAIEKVSGLRASLAIAHAAYASLMTGLKCELPLALDLADPRIRVSYLFYELCNFRNAEANVRKLEQEIASPTPELRPLLEAAGLIAAAEHGDKSPPRPARIEPAFQPKPEPEPALFSWLHLSDIHLGHKDINHRWDQQLVLDTLYRDISDHKKHGLPTPSTILITGDIAYSGSPDQYAQAQTWLDKLAATLNIALSRIFLVPGNHDIDRTIDHKNRNVARLIRGLREGDDSLDDALANPDDRALLTSRLTAYLSFASAYPSIQTPDPLFWSHAFTTPSGLLLRLIGLSTPLLAAGDIDHGKLRLGNAALAATLTDTDKSRELVLVLTHHPLRGGWLADQRDADRWLQSRAHIHLFGHVHEAEAEDARSGAGAGLLRVASGAAYSDLLPPGIPASHGYSIGAVFAAGNSGLRICIWPRKWSDHNKDFRIDVNNVPEGRSSSEHTLSGLRLPARAGSS